MSDKKTNLTFILWHIVDSFLSDVLSNLYVQLNNGTGWHIVWKSEKSNSHVSTMYNEVMGPGPKVTLFP